MDSSAFNHCVATAVRIEHDPNSDKVFLVFEVTDPKFKQRIKHDWTQDIELVVIGKSLKVNV